MPDALCCFANFCKAAWNSWRSKGNHVFVALMGLILQNRYNHRPISALTSNFDLEPQPKDNAHWSEVCPLAKQPWLSLKPCWASFWIPVKTQKFSECTKTCRAGLHEKHVQQPARTCLLGFNISSNLVLWLAPCTHKCFFFSTGYNLKKRRLCLAKNQKPVKFLWGHLAWLDTWYLLLS